MAKPRDCTYFIRNLPTNRVNQHRPFLSTGTDYCGQFQFRQMSRTGDRATNGYIAIFVCFTTKAIHLEMVNSLTTELFLAALK